MATAYERRPGTIPGYDWKAATRATRRFIVDAPPETIRPGGPVVSGLPQINESHPTIVGARVDSFEVIPLADQKNVCEVDVYYSTNREFSLPVPPLDPTTNGFESFSGTFEMVTTRIEIARKVVRSVPSPSGGAAVQQVGWDYGESVFLDVLEPRQAWTLRLALNAFTNSDRADINDQVGKIHELSDGEYYLFQGADVSQTTEVAWEVRYRWIGDSGTYAPKLVNAIPVQNGDLIYPPGLSGSALFRAPFSQWKTADPDWNTNPTGYPKFIKCDQYVEELNGWQTLPGIS